MIKHRLQGILLLLFTSIKLLAQDISSQTAIVLPLAGQSPYVVNSGATVHITSGTSITLGPNTVLSSGSTVVMSISNNLPITPAPSNPSADASKNWVLTRSYDENGNEIGAGKQFYDNNGKPTQAQTKNESLGHVLASQTLYDLQGRPVVNTLAAPINNSAFAYNNNFITSNNNFYSYVNFDGDPNSSNPYAKVNAPDFVDNTSSLGKYYSDNNPYEPLVGFSALPYSRADFYRDGSGGINRAAGIGEPLAMGSGHESTTNSFPVQHELDNYLAIRNQFFPSSVIGASPTTLNGQVVQTVSKDQNGTSVLSITDASGKQGLMSGRADASGNAWLSVTNTLNLNNVTKEYRFSLTTGWVNLGYGYVSTGVQSFSISSYQNVIVYQNGTQVYSGIGNDYVPQVSSDHTSSMGYLITSFYPFTLSAKDVDNVTSYDQAEASYAEPTGTPIQYFQLSSPSTVNITGSYTLYNMTSGTDITASFVNGVTQLSIGYYKVTATAPGTSNSVNNVTVTYSNKYSDISYNYYNQLGQLIASIAPNGVKSLIQNGYSGYTNVSQLPFVTTYQYDLQGRLIASTSPDGGTSNFIYRKDGKIRFSQNAYQANAANSGTGNERFSYTNYDEIGRPIESGEYTTTSGTFASLVTNTTVLEASDADGGLSISIKNDWVKTHYDVADNSHGLSGYAQDEGFLKGAVSWTENSNAKTWYSYDDHGRVTWTIKQISGLGNKTVDYVYNQQSNVTRVDYQKDTPDERFIHYYDYDADGRLINVQTSKDDVTKLQQAKYYYYLHGPLKRTELGDQLQGIDYVYTPQGWLKSINGATGDPTKDPHQDGILNSFAKDAFGMQLEYFSNDYIKLGSSINSLSTGQPAFYNGNVSGLSWQSNKPSSIVSVAGAAVQNPAMYSYGFDSKYQLTGATYGTPDFVNHGFTPSAAYSEKNMSYDANGNIIGLQRTDNLGALKDDFNSYQYQAGTNKLTSVGNAGNAADYASYTYDELGRLKSEQKSAESYYLKYDVTGKITGIYADAGLTQLKVSYAYDESGNRISRTDVNNITTYYVYDASGNTLAIYTGTTLTEMPVYGADRLGTYTLAGNNYVYELRDNVGSVRVVINRTLNSQGQANVVQYNDYYPYGSIAQSGGSGYRYEYQGAYAEKDPVTNWNNFDLRMYDGKIGRWLSVDPKHQYASPYVGMGNNPATQNDPTGGVSPIFDDETGNYLGDDSWGFFKGDVLFMSKDDFNKVVDAGGSHDLATKLGVSAGDLPENEQGIKLFANAVNYIDKRLYQTYYKTAPVLYNNSVSFYSKFEDINHPQDLRTAYGEENGDGLGMERISVNFDERKSLNTAPNLFSLFEHEYEFHGVQNITNRLGQNSIEPKVYKLQSQTPIFKYVTGPYRDHVLGGAALFH